MNKTKKSGDMPWTNMNELLEQRGQNDKGAKVKEIPN